VLFLASRPRRSRSLVCETRNATVTVPRRGTFTRAVLYALRICEEDRFVSKYEWDLLRSAGLARARRLAGIPESGLVHNSCILFGFGAMRSMLGTGRCVWSARLARLSARSPAFVCIGDSEAPPVQGALFPSLSHICNPATHCCSKAHASLPSLLYQ